LATVISVLAGLPRPLPLLKSHWRSEPDFAECYARLGAAFVDHGNFEDNPRTYGGAAIQSGKSLCFFQSRDARLGIGRNEEAIRSFDEALAIDPGFSQGYCNKGHALAGLDRLDEALMAFRIALCLNPGMVLALTNMGSAFANLGRFDRAIKLIETATVLEPLHAGAHYNEAGAH